MADWREPQLRQGWNRKSSPWHRSPECRSGAPENWTQTNQHVTGFPVELHGRH